MKIALIAHWDTGRETGVIKKLRAQVRAWQELGLEVRLFLLSPTTRLWEGLQGLPLEVEATRGLLERERKMQALVARVAAWRPDVAYLRYSVHFAALRSFMRQTPTFLELNTNDVGEYRLYLPAYKYWYHRLTRGRLLRRASGMVCLTHEIAEVFRAYGAPMTVIANGIDLARHQPVPPSDHATGSVRAVFVGSPDSPWHGVDKIVTLARSLPEWQFDIIGPRIAGDLPTNLVLHGFLSHDAYRSILAQADVAFGSLALDRNMMTEACPLKVREYLALGLPCVIGYRDTDFTPAPDFILELPAAEDNVVNAVAEIREFGLRWRGRRVTRESVAHLDLPVKERQRIAFMQQHFSASGSLRPFAQTQISR